MSQSSSSSHSPGAPTESVSDEYRDSLGSREKKDQIVQITLDDGAELQAWVHSGTGAPLVFLYGLGCSKAHWKYQVRHFQDMGRLTIQIDYRGHGRSTLGSIKRPIKIAHLVDDIAFALQALKAEHSIVCGQSMGGSIAMKLAHDHPSLVSALILQGSPGREPFSRMNIAAGYAEKFMKFLTELNRKSPKTTRFLNQSAGKIPFIARELVRLQGFNGQLARTEDIDEYVHNFFANDPNLFYELAEDLHHFDISKLERIIETPALILAGAQDHVVPVHEMRWLAKRLPSSELEIYPHGSHCVHLEDPGQVNRRIAQYLKTYNL
ncbi:MAG: alpha/beta hydrolase [Proteobacteria bacterium]|nr:alpha/beta hydrolase [Pseudomonadota bacterium]